MKTFTLYLLAVCWCCCWFLGCGGETTISNSNQQSQNQTNEGDIQTAQDACSFCADNRGQGETLTSCVMSLGFDIRDC
jgi:hypothetical protein